MDFHITENREAHKTDDYEAQQLIIRRGQTFDVTVTFNREYQPDSDVIILQFVTGWQLNLTTDEMLKRQSLCFYLKYNNRIYLPSVSVF